MKKILFIHHAGNFSGAARSLAYLISSLDRKEFIPEILVIQKGTATEFFQNLNVNIIVNDKLYPFHGTTVSGMSLKRFVKNWIGFFLTIFRFPKQLKKIQPDIIHLNTSCLFAFALVTKFFNKKIKVISHIREPLLDSFHGTTLRYFNEKYVDQFIAISNYDGSKFKAREKVKVIYNFVDVQKYRPTPQGESTYREKLQIEDNKVVFLYLSRVSSTNGALEFISVAKEIVNTHSNFAFIIAGFDYQDNSSYNNKVRILSQNLNNVFLLEMIENVIDLISGCDVIVSPFMTPHFSRSVIEGAAMGIPAIISNVGSQNELVVDGHSGIIYETDDMSSLRNAILLLGSNEKLRKKMGINARSIAVEKFSLEKNVIDTINTYKI